MRLKLKAFLDLHQDAAADALIDEMVKYAPANSEAARIASVLKAASMARKGDNDKALAVYDDVIKASTDENTLAYAWVNKAVSLYALQKYDPAVLAYLHIPVFYPEQKILMPTVLMGSGRCYVHLENLPEAQNSYNDLVDQFPSSPEAAAAKVELKKIAKLIPAASTTPSPDSTSTPAASPSPAPDSNATPAATPASSPAGATSAPATPK
jgi:tetratricopeptide (TPR) repeat protein